MNVVVAAALFDADDGGPNTRIVQFVKLLICPVDRNRRVYTYNNRMG